MAGTEVLTEQMLQVAGRVEDIIGRLGQSVRRLHQLGAEIDGMWDGEAGSKFAVVMNHSNERFEALSKMLTTYVVTLRQNVSIYAKAESDAIDMFNSNKIL